MKDHNYAVIMAGGVGSRFWPVSKQANPKQFQDILGCGESLLQTTFKRLAQFIPESNIYISTNEIYKDLIKLHLPSLKEEQIVLEPVMRNTAPCILLAAMKIFKKDAKARMLIAPSDHWIQTKEQFQADMELALEASTGNEVLLSFGIPPSFPNTGYGYIQYKQDRDKKILPVKRFTEKPDFATAEKFIASGDYLWNSGIFIWKASSILKKFEIYLPEMFQLFSRGLEKFNTPEETNFLAAHYHLAENISIDYAIIEKAENVKVIPASFSWNDLGTWGSIQNELPADKENNTIVNSRLISMQSKGNIIRTEKDKIVLIDGLEDYMILENREILLIVPKTKQQEIKNFRQNVMDTYGEELG